MSDNNCLLSIPESLNDPVCDEELLETNSSDEDCKSLESDDVVTDDNNFNQSETEQIVLGNSKKLDDEIKEINFVEKPVFCEKIDNISIPQSQNNPSCQKRLLLTNKTEEDANNIDDSCECKDNILSTAASKNTDQVTDNNNNFNETVAENSNVNGKNEMIKSAVSKTTKKSNAIKTCFESLSYFRGLLEFFVYII